MCGYICWVSVQARSVPSPGPISTPFPHRLRFRCLRCCNISKGCSMAIVYPRTTHREAHFTGSATVRDVVIGMSDGLTVPFALAAGLSGAVDSSFVVLVAGVAEMAAGSMAMGLGGYLAARSEADSYRSEL